MTHGRYLHVWPSGGALTEACLSENEIEAEGWWCSECRLPKPDSKEIDIRIKSRKPVNAPVCCVLGYFVGIVSLEILDIFDPSDVEKDLYLGSVEGNDGLPLVDWVTVHARNRLIVRGSKHASTRRCETCGQLHYSALPPDYIYPSVSNEITIFQSHLPGLVFPIDYASRLGGVKMKGVTVEELKVENAPLDGLGELLD